jgi:L-amino acid N-acyltransferase YncA
MTPPAAPAAFSVRASTDADVLACVAIYAHAVHHGTGTFELDAPDAADMHARRQAVLKRGWPWLVAERITSETEGSGDVRPVREVLGYAYANDFRPRRAYRFCLEDSIYIAPEAKGLGVGRALLTELLVQCEARGARQMLAVIGDSGNAGSIALHRTCGFEPCGQFNAAGWKFDRWLDVVLMQRALGVGAKQPAVDRQEPT